ncbi:hypothetical protein PP568_09920 [Mycobacteroides abscessus]|nr:MULTISPECIES: hypothetical protein [Mycobacteroides]MDM2407112.1 hypothetical protein [Mycobacteroides abscessus]MBN7461993.1 hypothetical protein [Mycobacteroides abscessus subsp. abscessus]MDM2414968.1 hypothetical protein [Mycobacteroides abscessus]SHU64934.1 Uncharacterised protein [Mycobacteroides abscessus subsp. abscessus]SIA78933.1 Uncharacterised protein [Mycobacteroides abscessus subsp. abscessus]
MTQEELNRRAVEVAERSRLASALAAESLRAQWLVEPNRTFVVENKKEED